MTKTSENKTEWKGGIFYKTEDDFCNEALRFLKTRRKNRGATEWQIYHVAVNRPFVTVLDQAREEPSFERFRTKQEELLFFTGLRRSAVVKKLLNEGYTVAEISDALTLPYSTTYYYAKKIRNHKRLREDRIRWHIDTSTQCIAPIKLSHDKEAALARKEVMRKAKEKRERRMAKRAALQTRTAGSAA